MAAIVLPEYARDRTRPVVTPLTVVSAAQALATQALGAHAGGRNIGELFRVARQIPCYRMRYADPSVGACELARLVAASSRS